MSLIKQLAGETAIYGISSILSRLLNYVILTPYLTRVFLEKEYGVISEMYTYIALLMVLLTYRMETAFFRFGSKDEDLNRTFSTAASSLIVTSLIFLGAMLLMAQPIAELLEYPDNKDYVILFSLILVLDALSAIPFARLRLENRPFRFAIIKTFSIVVNIFFIFFFLEGCPKLIEQGFLFLENIFDKTNRISYVFLANVLGSAFMLIMLFPEYLKIKFGIDRTLIKRMLFYAMPLILVGLAGVINQLISAPLLKWLLPGTPSENLAQVGKYSAAAKLAVLMSLFIQAFNYAAEPFFFRNAAKNDSKIIYAQVGQAFAVVGSIVFLGIMLYLDVIQLFIGKGFRDGLSVVPILLIAYFFLGLYYNFSIWYKITDRTIIGAYISFGGAIITLMINFIFIPKIGYTAPAWAALSCYFFMAGSSYLIGRKHYPIPYPIVRMMIYIVLAVALWGVSIMIGASLENFYVLKFVAITGILLFYFTVLFFMEKDKVMPLLK